MLIAATHAWAGGTLSSDLAFEVEDGTITATRPLGTDTPDARVHLAMPGCSDLQVNGGGGVMLNDHPTAEAMRQIAGAHHGCGTHEIMPTVITDTPEVMEAAAQAAIDVAGTPGLLGLHIEGPHINAARRGTHAERFIRPMDDRTMAVLSRLRLAGVPVILTLAPETVSADQIRAIRALGVIVSAGHSAATLAQARAGIEAGVTMFTHLFNAMPPIQGREPGLVGAAILSDGYAGIIADGIHVSYEGLRLAMAARPQGDRMFLVSDAMATVGGPDHFTLYGQTITVRDGALTNAEGSLAGAHIDMVSSLRNIHLHAGVALDKAVAMATDIPRAAIGLPPRPGAAAGTALSDLIFLNSDLTLMEPFQ